MPQFETDWMVLALVLAHSFRINSLLEMGIVCQITCLLQDPCHTEKQALKQDSSYTETLYLLIPFDLYLYK